MQFRAIAVSFALLGSVACGSAEGTCSLDVAGAVEGTFGWCNAFVVSDSRLRVVAELLDSCPSDGFCSFLAEFTVPSAVPGEASCGDGAVVNLLHPSFDDPATEEAVQDGGAADFRDGSSCSISTDAFDAGFLSGEESWSGTITATLQLNDSDEHVEISVEGSVPALNQGFAVDSDPNSKR